MLGIFGIVLVVVLAVWGWSFLKKKGLGLTSNCRTIYGTISVLDLEYSLKITSSQYLDYNIFSSKNQKALSFKLRQGLNFNYVFML